MQEKLEVFKKYVEENQDAFYRLAFSYTKNYDAALDVVQEALLKSIDKLSTLKNIEYLKTWFYRILVNEGLNYLRKNKRLVLVEDFEFEKSELSSCDNIAESIDMYSAVQALEPKIRTVIILRFLEDMKLKEISKITKTNVSTVKSRLYKGLELLKISIDEE